MKNKIFLFYLSALFVFFTSCKKESSVSIVGQWTSVSIYTMMDNGTYSWASINGWPQTYNFSTEGRFSFIIDPPSSGGSYNYDESLQKLTLYYEASRYGTGASTRNLIVEMLDRDKLILTYSLPSGDIYKVEYSRVK